MAYVTPKDAVWQLTTSTGTGDLTPSGEVPGYRGVADALADGNTTYFRCGHRTASPPQWEVFRGTYHSATNTVSRDAVLASSNAGAAVAFSAGDKDLQTVRPDLMFPAFVAGAILYGGANGLVNQDAANLSWSGSALTVGGSLALGGAVTAGAWNGAAVAVAYGGTGAATAAAARAALGVGTAGTLAFDADGTLAANSDANVATQKATKTYVDQAVTGLLDFKGSTDTSTNPNYPAASKGDAYVVSVAGKVGGAAGKSLDVGDVYVASADNAGGTEAAVGASWFVLEHNLVGALLAANNLSDVASAATARTNLGLTIGTDVQAYDATLTALAGLTVVANSLTVGTGADAFTQTAFAANTFPARAGTGNLVAKTITDFGLSLVAAADAAAARTTLGTLGDSLRLALLRV